MRYSKIFYSLLFSTVVKCGTTNTPTSCPSSIIEQGYSCCSDSNCEIVYTDESGDWAIENGEWCGCGGNDIVTTTTTNIVVSTDTPKSCPSSIIEQGYSCCSNSNCEVVYTDESGDWAIENGEWCGCGGNDITSNTTTTTVSTTITPIHSTSTNCFNSTGHTGESVEISSNRVGDINGVNYELWADSGSNNAIFYGDGSFSCSFQNSVDYICRSGLSFDGTKTHDQIGHLFADFSFVEINAEKVDFSYVGVYGWTKYPVVEFFIVDNWLNQSRPEDWSYYKNHGDFVIDDATYTIYERNDFKFSQFFSVRKEARNCGRIDISAHLTLWGKLGMKLGNIDEAKVFAEAGSYESRTSGEVDFPYAKVFIDNSVDIPDFSDIIIPTPTPTTTITTTITPIQSTRTNCFNSSGHSGESVEITNNSEGDINGINYEVWADGGSHNSIFYSDGSFSFSFQKTREYLCYCGLNFDGTKTYKETGQLYADFEFVSKNVTDVDYSFVGVYGLSKKNDFEIFEYHIIDSWLCPYRPGDWVGNKKYGDFVIDGATYTVYSYDQNRGDPGIGGLYYYHQFFSVRKEPRNCGRIDITAHLEQWEKLGMESYAIKEFKIFVEAGSNGSSGCSGEVDFPYAKVFIDDIANATTTNTSTTTTVTTSSTTTTAITLANPTEPNCFNSTGHTGESVEITNNSEGDINGINYEVWADGGSHNSIFYSDGSFSFSFQKTREYLCYCGLNFDGTKTYKETGQLYADFEFVSKNVTDVDYSFVGVYGLSKKNDFEIFEYHIIDSWLCPYRPGDWVGNKKYGDFVIDGATYTVYSYDQNRGDPGIGGLYYYHQFFSVRKEPRNCGRIDITAHLEQWEKLGMESYAIKEFKIFVEAGSNGSSGCSGEVDFPYAKIFIDNTTTTTTPSSTCTTTKTPTSQNCFNSSGHFGENVKVNGNEVGEINGVDYESWGETGENNATFYSNGSFTCSFQNSIDYLCRSGLSLDTTKTHDQIGHLYADFEFIEQNIENVDTSYIGIYGWSKLTDGNILVEYYIIDSWISESRPGDWEDYQNRGDFFIDGAMYTVYENNRNSGPGTFKQYISVRKEARSCGRIDITAHFNYWEKLNMTVGKIAEVKILAEAMSNGSGGSGTVDFPYANVFIDNSGDEPNRQGIY